jgi:flagella basal body P-ring formation protein FlgA
MMMWHLYCMNSGMFKPSVKTSTPAQALMQILCLTVFWLCVSFMLHSAYASANTTANTTANTSAPAKSNPAADAMGLQVRQWMSQTHGVNVKDIVIAPLDDRLKVQGCQKPLNVDHPFASKETVRVRCAEPVWQLYLQVAMPTARSTAPLAGMPAGAPNSGALPSAATSPSLANPPRTIVVAKRLLQRGVILQPDMLEEVQASPGNADTQLLNTVRDAQLAELTRDIPAGQALRVSDIRRAVLVKQGQTVMLSIGNKSDFEISIRMEAMQDGRLGDQVKLRNPESGRQVSGIVTGPNAAKGL